MSVTETLFCDKYLFETKYTLLCVNSQGKFPLSQIIEIITLWNPGRARVILGGLRGDRLDTRGIMSSGLGWPNVTGDGQDMTHVISSRMAE